MHAVAAVLCGACLAAKLPVNDVLDRMSSAPQRQARGAADAAVMLWPGCSVPYAVVEDEGCSFSQLICDDAADAETAVIIRRSISVASNELERLTTCRFYEDSADASAVLVTAKNNSCYVNHVGKVASGRNIMNIGRMWCSTDEGAVKHELLHTLGIEHEHQSPTSDDMLNRCADGSCNPDSFNCRIDESVIEWSTTLYDPRSIMHYPIGRSDACDLTLTSAGHTARARAGISQGEIGNVDNISSKDAALVRTMYGLQPAPSPSPSPSPSSSGISDGVLVAVALGGVALIAGLVVAGTMRAPSGGPVYKPLRTTQF